MAASSVSTSGFSGSQGPIPFVTMEDYERRYELHRMARETIQEISTLSNTPETSLSGWHMRFEAVLRRSLSLCKELKENQIQYAYLLEPMNQESSFEAYTERFRQFLEQQGIVMQASDKKRFQILTHSWLGLERTQSGVIDSLAERAFVYLKHNLDRQLDDVCSKVQAIIECQENRSPRSIQAVRKEVDACLSQMDQMRAFIRDCRVLFGKTNLDPTWLDQERTNLNQLIEDLNGNTVIVNGVRF